LVERGYLERLPHRARALAIKKLPDGLKTAEDAAATVTQMPMRHIPDTMMEIPLYGKIAAGTPIEAIQHEGSNVFVAQDMMGAGEHYALIVEGDSMIKAGIHDSDTVIIQRCSNAENGTIIVALVDGQEATLKRLRSAGNKIVLEPENDTYEPQILEPERVQIQGRLVSLMRSYH
jgi:repressor LexA